MRYLDCGCALLDDGSRAWCPSCATGDTAIVSAEGLRQDREKIERLTRELEEARDVIDAQYKNIDGLIRELKERTRELEEARDAMLDQRCDLLSIVLTHCDNENGKAIAAALKDGHAWGSTARERDRLRAAIEKMIWQWDAHQHEVYRDEVEGLRRALEGE